MCLLEALYLCITGGGSKGKESLQYIAVEFPSALNCTVREEGGELNNLDEHCKSMHVGDFPV